MKIVVVADTHHNYPVFRNIVVSNNDADLFIHLGDGENEFIDVKREFPDRKLLFIKGNGDYVNIPTTQIITVSGYKILCTHGYTYDVHNGLSRLIEAAKKEDCKIVLYGHTHIYQTKIEDGLYIMNPGSPTSPRNRLAPSYGVVEIDSEGNIKMDIMAIK